MKCPFCLSAADIEVHFVLCCPAFDDKIRVINPKYCNNPCEFRLTLLFAKQNERAQNIFLCVCIKHSAEEKPCYGEELEEDMRYTRRKP